MIQNNSDLGDWLFKYDPGGCYLFSKRKLESDFNFIKSNIEQNIVLAYSYKTNFYKELCTTLNDLGCLSEVVSPAEIECTKQYGINPKNIIYNGPIKDYSSIKYVLENYGLVNADSATDLILIEKIIQDLPNDCYRIGLRLDLGLAEKTRFGFEINGNSFKEAINKININQNIIFDCLHIHYPSRNLDSLEERLKNLFDLISSLKKKPQNIDLGGSYTSLLSETLSKQLKIPKDNLLISLQMINEFSKKIKSLGIEKVILEPGTAIASNSFLLCGKVCSINKKKDHNIINLNISKMNIGDINSNLKYPFTIYKKNNNFQKEGIIGVEKDYILCGNTCIEKDIFYSGRYSKISLDDYIVFESVGSYSYSFDNNFINKTLKVINLPCEINF